MQFVHSWWNLEGGGSPTQEIDSWTWVLKN